MIPHNKPTVDDDDIKSVVDTLNSKWIAPGEKVKEFECKLAKYLSHVGYAIAVDSGTSALHLALLALGIKRGDEVILPAYVCTAVLNAVNYTGATPVLTDINSYDFNISYEDTVKKITDNTRAMIIPHMYGIPADIDKFLELGVPIIEDCAQSISARFKNQKVGTFGDISMFSFYATKLLTTAKGGAIYSKNRELIDSIYDLVNFDYRPTYKVRYNYHLSDFEAALGLSQLRKLDSFIKRRKEIAEEYNEVIEKKKDAFIVKIQRNKERVWYRYVIISDKKTEKIKEEFLKNGIEVINPLENWESLHNYLHLDREDFPNAENITKKTISVPIYPSLSDEEIEKIKKAIDKIYSEVI
jgi:dTDP-4-amino-4,6-dideoxygalactose transaminase